MFELIESATFDATTARGRARIPAELPWLADHFPGVPVLPGSVQLELCAQLAGPLAERAVSVEHGVERWAFLGMVRHAVFHAVAPLPAELELTAELRRVEPSSVVVAVTASSGELLCRAELVMVLREPEPAWAAAIAAARERVARWTRR
jgi:3-hydroxymyristoyl/3-hydroxydecanoyl-(acyl carrier protein) dehydratase